ncbi:MAG: hypothetical protein GTN62_03355 [Gemmatimonadales bacterium]|nr:hypothetical protein [Gemmatimonadales bacterium]NIN49136.1 hypothetical protein [Gemmatimonadales bacterium]NIP06600.1 hypothetical protein [Gemmatimonadales bacterium]NIR00297.1 hypothetical protein [Gemmatimonadales bacterium]NIS64630.1 hypothetical protein [Gemmatimonadales bacterium]
MLEWVLSIIAALIALVLLLALVGLMLPKRHTAKSWVSLMQPGSTITITEDGDIYNPIFRVMSRLFLGYHATMDGYLTALGRKLGEEVTPVHAS